MYRILILLCISITISRAQQIELTLPASVNSHFYIESVTDGRKDTLNNGSITSGGKKSTAVFNGGIAAQVQKFTSARLTPAENKLAAIITVKKIFLSDRVSGNSRIYKADLSLEFKRKDRDVIIDLVDLSTWIEQGGSKTGSDGVQEKNISEILIRMLTQFEELVLRQHDDPLFAPHIEFKVTGNKPAPGETDTIFWNEKRKLTWDDFKGEPSGTYFAALSNCAFAQSVEPNSESGKGIIYIYLRAALLKKGSWVKKDQANDDILKHEQLHFDIAEWQVRKLRKAISEASLNLLNYEVVINRLSSDAWTEYNKLQSAYDSETKHGTVTTEQEKWNKTVAAGLKELESYQ